MSLVRTRIVLALAASWLATVSPAQAQITIRSGTAPDVPGITVFRDQFRTDVGGGTTAGANGLFDDGVRQRREINWDGVPDAFAAPNNLPANFFNVNSPRGAVFGAVGGGTGFQVSSTTASGVPVNFGNIDATYTATFLQFSPQRLFTPVGNNQMDVTFFVPGTNTPAVTSALGVLFTDVEQANTTSLQFFDASGISLGTFFAPAQAGTTGFSFLGAFITNGSSTIGRVRITTGNTALAAGVTDNGTTRDLVVMDDFLYGNPVAVPEPSSLALTTCAALAVWRRFRSRVAAG
jgi:hypothetical protein